MTGYPIGLQDFNTLRKENYIYIDKTQYIEKLVEDRRNYSLLTRPPRFGKSLFLSTLQCFFEGKRNLFKGLYVDSINWDWEEYPVFRLDLNYNNYEEIGGLDILLDEIFKKWETEYDVKFRSSSLGLRFLSIIAAAHEKTGRRVVILVDNYDKPLVDNINNQENLKHYGSRLSSLYSNFKTCAEHIRLVFLAGVNHFGNPDVYSAMNNISDISFSSDYANICGITEKEMLDNFQEDISSVAEKNGISEEEARAQLKENYGGYLFAKNGSEIYNPFSLLDGLNKKMISNHENDAVMANLIATTLKRAHADVLSLIDCYCTEDVLRGLDFVSPQPLGLLYQTGYLTIKRYHPKIKRFQLGIPNNEVRDSLFSCSGDWKIEK